VIDEFFDRACAFGRLIALQSQTTPLFDRLDPSASHPFGERATLCAVSPFIHHTHPSLDLASMHSVAQSLVELSNLMLKPRTGARPQSSTYSDHTSSSGASDHAVIAGSVASVVARRRIPWLKTLPVFQ
jgi:hypothetical protein